MGGLEKVVTVDHHPGQWGMFHKIETSWKLVKASGKVLVQDKRLLVFPLISGAATVVVCLSFFVPLLVFNPMGVDLENPGPWTIGAMVLFYTVQYAVIFFFNSALVATALLRLSGKDSTVSDGLWIAWRRWDAILGYALISATVGVFLHGVSERAGPLGKLGMSLLGVAWTLATYLVVPILVTRNVGPIQALRESVSLLKTTWGEQIAGHLGMGVVFGVAGVVLAGVGAGAIFVTLPMGPWVSVPVIVTAVAGFALYGLVCASLQGIYCAALYRYAVTGEAGTGFRSVDLERAFR
jgi:hypothetical protein